MRFVFLAFVLIPIIEITLLINVGQWIGVGYTVALVLLSAFVGVNMLRYQGVSTLTRAQQKMRQGELPGQEMAEGLVLAVGGALLITPGFVTDVMGFCCLIPWTRLRIVHFLRGRMFVMAQTSTYQETEVHHTHFRAAPQDEESSRRRPEVLEGEFTRKD